MADGANPPVGSKRFLTGDLFWNRWMEVGSENKVYTSALYFFSKVFLLMCVYRMSQFRVGVCMIIRVALHTLPAISFSD